MLHDQHIRILTGRAVGGDFMKIIHLPTGISRIENPPLGKGKEVYLKRKRMLLEIENELIEKGLIQYIWHPSTNNNITNKK